MGRSRAQRGDQGQVGDQTRGSELADVRLETVTKRFGGTVAVLALLYAIFQRRTAM